MKKFLTFLLLFLLTGTGAFAIEEVQSENINDNSLYLSDCIKIAIKRSPIVKKARLNALAAEKDVKISKSNYFPTFNTSVGYWQGFNTDRDFDDGYTKRFLPSVGVYLNQLLFDFGKTSAQIDMNKFNRLAAQYTFYDALSSVANDVKVKYFAALEAKAIVEIEENNLLISQKILDTTKKLYDEKKKNEIDYINAEVYLSSAKMNLTKAQNDYNQAMADLANAMYIAGEPDFQIVSIDTVDYYEAYFDPEFLLAPKGTWHEIKQRERQQDTVGEVQNMPFTLEFALDSANKYNPELKVLNSTLEAMKKSALAIKRDYYPTISGRVGYEYNTKYVENPRHTATNNQLNVALTADMGANPMKYSNELQKANIQIELAENDIELFKQDMYFEVKKRYMDVETAQKQILASKEKVSSAHKNLESAKVSYSKNQIGYLEVQSARQNYNSSKIEYINELNAYNISLSRLEHVTRIFEQNFRNLLLESLSEKDMKLLNLQKD